MGVVADVQTYLAAQGLVDGVTGWTSQRRALRDGAGDQVVMVAEDGGRGPEIPYAYGIGDEALKDPGVLITVRAGAWDSDASFAKAQAIHSALHGLLDTTLDATIYLRLAARTSEPVFAGFDDQNRPIHTIGFLAMTSVS